MFDHDLNMKLIDGKMNAVWFFGDCPMFADVGPKSPTNVVDFLSEIYN